MSGDSVDIKVYELSGKSLMHAHDGKSKVTSERYVLGRRRRDVDVAIEHDGVYMVVGIVEVDYVVGERRVELELVGLVHVDASPVELHRCGEVIPAVLKRDESVLHGDLVTDGFLLAERIEAVSIESVCGCLDCGRLVVVYGQVPAVLGRCNRNGAVRGRDSATHASARGRMDVVTAHYERAITVVDVDVVCVGVVGQYDIAAKCVKRYLERIESSVEVGCAVIALTTTMNKDFEISTSCGFPSRVDDLEFRRQ